MNSNIFSPTPGSTPQPPLAWLNKHVSFLGHILHTDMNFIWVQGIKVVLSLLIVTILTAIAGGVIRTFLELHLLFTSPLEIALRQVIVNTLILLAIVEVFDGNGSLASLVFVDIAWQDLGTYVQKAKTVVQQQVKLPPGYTLQWVGQYTYMEWAQKRLLIGVPLTLFLIFLLLYFNFHSVPRCLLVLLAIPFSVVGAIGYLYFLNYDLSIAVWIGMIALAGLAAETGVIMIMFLDDACARRQRENRLKSIHDLREAIFEWAVLRVRPKIMTASAIMLGLLPIMWSQGTGADVMKRIAAPMIGGMVTATVLTLLVIPVTYFIWRSRSLKSRI